MARDAVACRHIQEKQEEPIHSPLDLIRVHLQLGNNSRKALGHRDATADAKRLAGDLDAGRGLAAFVLVDVNQPDDPLDRRLVVAGGDDRLGVLPVDHVRLEDAVEHVVRRQRILVDLVGPQFGGRRLGDRRLRDDLALAVDPIGQAVNLGLG